MNDRGANPAPNEGRETGRIVEGGMSARADVPPTAGGEGKGMSPPAKVPQKPSTAPPPKPTDAGTSARPKP